ncbi:MAG: hypothetical protein O7G30_04395 [Proteobacteria bacterium]|nr:hypothetical protein [Pseudomonadota bacterium]
MDTIPGAMRWIARRFEDTALRVALLAALATATACESRSGPATWNAAEITRADVYELVLDADATPTAGDPLRVRLAFGGAADLDLYVTGPLHETVYFANSPSSTGGVLDVDQRCDAEVPRVETITFPETRPGRYRIGIDYAEACSSEPEALGVVLRLELGDQVAVRRELVEPGRFRPIVWEFDVAR